MVFAIDFASRELLAVSSCAERGSLTIAMSSNTANRIIPDTKRRSISSLMLGSLHRDIFACPKNRFSIMQCNMDVATRGYYGKSHNFITNSAMGRTAAAEPACEYRVKLDPGERICLVPDDRPQVSARQRHQ